MSILQGIVCANITPFDEEKNVDYESVRNLARYLADSGIQAIYPLGTNGEGLALSLEERKKIAEVMVEEMDEDGSFIGRTRYDAPEIDNSVIFRSDRELKAGMIVNVKIEDAFDYDLTGMEV